MKFNPYCDPYMMAMMMNQSKDEDSLLKTYRAIKELVKEETPKKEEKKPDPDAWGIGDYITFSLTFHSLFIFAETLVILYFMRH